MRISINSREVITREEERDLQELLGVTTNAELKEKLAKVVKAALREHVDMFLGKGVWTRGDDLLMHRLYLLTKHYFENRIPTEEEVSSLFQLIASRSRSLIRNVLSKYKSLLEDAITETVRKILSDLAGGDPTQPKEATIPWNLVEEMNRILKTKRPELKEIRKVTGTAGMYKIEPDSYNLLCQELNVDTQ